VNHKYIGHLGQQRDRDEVPADVVGLVFQHGGVDGQRADVAEDEGVAVGRCLGDFLHRQHAGAAWFVLDIDALAELLAQFAGDSPRDDFRGAAGGEGHHEAHRLRRPDRCSLAKRGRQGQRRGAQAGGLQHGAA